MNFIQVIMLVTGWHYDLITMTLIYRLMVEETIGLSLAMSGTVAARGKDILKELDFFCEAELAPCDPVYVCMYACMYACI
jgi:hypothetical protein